jgi:hypothetical protein
MKKLFVVLMATVLLVACKATVLPGSEANLVGWEKSISSATLRVVIQEPEEQTNYSRFEAVDYRAMSELSAPIPGGNLDQSIDEGVDVFLNKLIDALIADDQTLTSLFHEDVRLQQCITRCTPSEIGPLEGTVILHSSMHGYGSFIPSLDTLRNNIQCYPEQVGPTGFDHCIIKMPGTSPTSDIFITISQFEREYRIVGLTQYFEEYH